MKAFAALHQLDNEQFKDAARKYSRQCYEHAAKTLILEEDREMLKQWVIH